MSTKESTNYSIIHLETAKQAFDEVVLPYLRENHPELVDSVFFAVTSSVAYGLADEYSDIDLMLTIPAAEYAAREEQWFRWGVSNPVADLARRKNVTMGVGVTTWDLEGVSLLLGGQGSWDDLYNDHLHWVQNLIPIYDPLDQMGTIKEGLTRMPEGLGKHAAAKYAGELADLRYLHQTLGAEGHERFVGLLGYNIAFRALPLLFHRRNEPMPFHKWQWHLAERLGEDARVVLRDLRSMLEMQFEGGFAFPSGLIDNSTLRIAYRKPPLPLGVSLPEEQVNRALQSIQWHLAERGNYQMVRARNRGWQAASLHYMCATRCLLIKGTILMETGQIIGGEDVSGMWDQVRGSVPGLDECLWPRVGEDPFTKTLEGIDLFRRKLRDMQALPQQYLDNPLSSPPSYELECILEEL